jgi:putative spermidine/putrescine transport system permease protein
VASAVVLISATLQGFDRTLERAAMSLGANQLKTFLRVVFPVIRAGVLSAGLFAFIYSFDELLIALFVSGVKGTTLPKKMWEGITEMINPTIAAASSLLIVFTVVFLVVLQLLQRGKRETDKT